MENQQNRIFANCSQTNFAMRKFRKLFANQFRIAKSNKPVHCSFAKISSHKAYAKFRIAKIRNEFANQIRNANFAKPISQCQMQFRNAKIFAIPNSQCENFAMRKFAMRKFRKVKFAMPKPISQCQIQMPISISQCQNTVHLSQPMRNFALRNSQPTLRISQTHFALRNSLRKFAGLVILCN